MYQFAHAWTLTSIGIFALAEFHNGDVMKDTNNNIIQAHQPHIFKEGSTYYWYGSAQVASSSGKKGAVNLYTSNDLSTWKFHGIIYHSKNNYVARPSMLGKNPRTHKYVLWAKGGGKKLPGSDSIVPFGPLLICGHDEPPEWQSWR